MSLLITGDSGDLGAMLVARSEAACMRLLPAWVKIDRTVGAHESVMDPQRDIGPALERLRPDVVVHFPWLRAGGRLARRRRLIVDATLATAAAAEHCGARRFVYWGSTAVYDSVPSGGGRPSREDDGLVSAPRVGFEFAEVDRGLRIWAQQAGGIELLLFRAAAIADGALRSPLSEMMGLPVMPRLAADVPMQLLHSADAVAILRRAADRGHPGVYNASGDGVLMYSAVCRGLDRTAVRLPRAFVRAVLTLWKGPVRAAHLLALLEAPVVVDNARLKTHFGLRPRNTTAQALAARG